jgi:putative tryptophan/tyrosine transport system substrate-binding protein
MGTRGQGRIEHRKTVILAAGMRRREFLCGIAAALSVQPATSIAQSSPNRPLVALLLAPSATVASRIVSGFSNGMRELGYVEGNNIEITYRYADGDDARIPEIVSEVIQLKPSVIVTTYNFAAVMAKKATGTIPIVCAGLLDPVGFGLIAGYAQPGSNVTGILYTASVGSVLFKWLDVALEMVPGATKMGLLVNARDATSEWFTQFLKTASTSMPVRFVPVPAHQPNDLNAAFQALKREDVQVLVVIPNALFANEHRRIAELATSARLPTLYDRDYVEVGGLMSYGIDLRKNLQRASAYVDKILKGAAPGDLSVEFPTKAELVINMKTAKVLGLRVPWSLLARADEMIE